MQTHKKKPNGKWNSPSVVVNLPSGLMELDELAGGIRVRFSASRHVVRSRVPVLLHETGPYMPAVAGSDGNRIVMKTALMSAEVNLKSGALTFRNGAGKTILSEVPGFRSLKPTTLDGPTPVHSYLADDVFRLQPGEAIYGLGQPQQGLLNYRGSSVFLEQQNREVAIPFVVSSAGYGMFWNNPSGTHVDVGGAVGPIPKQYLSDERGRKGVLTASYFKGRNFGQLVATRLDPGIDFDWNKKPPEGLPHDDYSVRWTGFLQVPKAATYVFSIASDDGARMWLDDQPVLSNWSVHPVETATGRVDLKPNHRYRVRVEFFQAGGGSEVHLSWTAPLSDDRIVWRSEAADQIDYVVWAGDSPDELIRQYRQATGNPPMPPKWALGYWQSKERYQTQQEWIDIASEYRRRQDPIDNIVQDWFYWDPWPWGTHKFDPKRYPNPSAAIQDLHDRLHMRLMISVWGKFNPGSDAYPDPDYSELDGMGALYPGSVSSPDRYYDAFDPKAGAVYWRQIREALFDKGIDAWWLDASEPEVNMSEFRKAPTAKGLGAQVLNAWPLMHTTNVSKGQIAAAPDKRVFILTRSAYAGQQRTGAATWSGDITADWQTLANQIPAGLNFAMSGIPYWTTDIGAFFVNIPGGCNNPAYRELYTRWFQFGAFCPIFRSHGTSTPREMWRFGPETEAILRKYDMIRYWLMPYIYSQAWEASRGGTIMRALAFTAPHDKTALECKDQFLFGPSLMVCPVLEPGAVSRRVYLPSGSAWYDFWTDKRYPGGTWIEAAAPIDRMPIYVKAGSILPLGPEMQYADQVPADPIELRLYPGANGRFTLYEDEGTNNNYQKGAFATIPMEWSETKRVLAIGSRKGTFPGMLKERRFVIRLPGASRAVTYAGKELRIER